MHTSRPFVADAKEGADDVDIARIIGELGVRMMKHLQGFSWGEESEEGGQCP